MTISVFLATDDPITGYTYGAMPPELAFECKRYSSSVRGGPVAAQIDVSGPEHILWTALEWLRRPVELRNGAGMVVWWGMVNEVELRIGPRVVGRTLDKMANRVRVAYAQETPGAGNERKTTEAIEDAVSIARYGTKELVHSLGNSTSTRAAAKAAELLVKSSNPAPLQTFSGGGTSSTASAVLYCVGWFETLKWRTYQRSGTRVVQAEGLSSDEQSIGWQLASNELFFSPSGLHDIQARLGALAPENVISVSGSGSNTFFRIAQATNDTKVTYTAATVFFGANDDIYDNGDGLGFIRNGELIRVSGSAQNSRVHFIDGTGTGHVTTSGISGAIVAEGAGPSIAIEQGHTVTLSPTPANDLLSTTKTIVLWGYRVAQSFVATFTMPIGSIGLNVSKVGSPADNLRVRLYSDSAGAPGTLLGSVELAEADIPATSDWVWFEFATRPNATSGVTYWIVVERSGTLSATDYYRVKMTTAAYGTSLAYNGSAWASNPKGEYLAFEVWGVQETTAQMSEIVNDAGDFLTGAVVEAASGILDNPDRLGDLTAYEELVKLLDVGTVAGARLIVEVSRDRVLRIFQKPDAPDAPDIYLMSGKIVLPGGQPRAEGYLPVGEWLAVERTPRYLGLSPVFVDESEFDAVRASATITPENSA